MHINLRHIFKGQLLRNSFWTFSDLVLYPLLMIGATPLFINQLGAEQYGLWMMLTVVVQLMNALNFGVGDSTIKYTSAGLALNQQKNIAEIVNRNVSLGVLLTLITTLLGVCAAYFIEQFELLAIRKADYTITVQVLVLFSLSAGLKFIEQVFLSVLKGYQRFDIAARLSMSSRVSVLLASAAVVSWGFGLLEIALVTVGCNIFNLFIQVLILRQRISGLNLFPRFRFNSAQEIFQQNGWYWLQSVIALIGFLSDRIIIGFYIDMATVGYYSIAALVGTQIHNVLLAFGSFVFPKVSARISQQKNIEQVYYVSRMAIAGLGWGIITCLMFGGSIIFKWWLGDTVFEASYPLIRLYLSFEAIILLIVIPYHFINGSQHLKLNSLFEFILRSSHVVFMLLLYPFYGLEGIVWALILTTAVNIPFQYYFFHKHILHQTGWRDALLPVLPAFLLIASFLLTHVYMQVGFLAGAVIVFKFVYWNKALKAFSS